MFTLLVSFLSADDTLALRFDDGVSAIHCGEHMEKADEVRGFRVYDGEELVWTSEGLRDDAGIVVRVI